MSEAQNIAAFRVLLKTAITYRSTILEPDHPFLKLPLTVPEEENIQMEQALLINILTEFNRLFPLTE